MDKRQKKQKQLSKLKAERYKIYGIFDFQTNTLVYVDLDVERTELEIELGDYDKDRYDVVSFDISLV